MSVFDRINKINQKIQKIQDNFGILDQKADAPTIPTSQISFSSILSTLSESEDIKGASAAYKPAEGAYADIINEASEKYNIDPALIKAVIMQESGFNPRAKSWCGAQGLMQLMPDTAKSLGVMNPYDPKENIMGGARYLRGLLDRFNNDISLALAGYNAGPGAVKKYGGVPPYRETQGYVASILSMYENYKKEGGD